MQSNHGHNKREYIIFHSEYIFIRVKFQFGDLIFSINFHTIYTGLIKIVEILMKISFSREQWFQKQFLRMNWAVKERKKVEDFRFPFKTSLNPCFDLRTANKRMVKNGDRPTSQSNTII